MVVYGWAACQTAPVSQSLDLQLLAGPIPSLEKRHVPPPLPTNGRALLTCGGAPAKLVRLPLFTERLVQGWLPGSVGALADPPGQWVCALLHCDLVFHPSAKFSTQCTPCLTTSESTCFPGKCLPGGSPFSAGLHFICIIHSQFLKGLEEERLTRPTSCLGEYTPIPLSLSASVSHSVKQG